MIFFHRAIQHAVDFDHLCKSASDKKPASTTRKFRERQQERSELAVLNVSIEAVLDHDKALQQFLNTTIERMSRFVTGSFYFFI